MDGKPVWLASLSRRDRAGQPRPSQEWTPEERREGLRLMGRMLAGVGDDTHERAFRMPLTLCTHRVLTPSERAWLPVRTPVHLAGGPLEILYEYGCAATPSTRPCSHPRPHYLTPGSTKHYLLRDCGECEPCLARRALEFAS